MIHQTLTVILLIANLVFATARLRDRLPITINP